LPAWPKATAIQVLLLLAVRWQLDVLALTPKEPVTAAAEIWMEDGFKVRVHWAAADTHAAAPSTNRYKDFKMI
jgi:hypothetical protein